MGVWITFGLRRRDISFWDVGKQKWGVAGGRYEVSVGASSRDVRVKGHFDIETV